MSKFVLSYNQETDYYNKVTLNVELDVKSKPSKEDMVTILDAIDTIDIFANKYIHKTLSPSVKEAKG